MKLRPDAVLKINTYDGDGIEVVSVWAEESRPAQMTAWEAYTQHKGPKYIFQN